MKKIISLAVFLLAFTFPSISSADSDSVFPLGYSHISVTTGLAIFTDGNVDDLGIDDGNYLGVAAYVALNPRVYLGLEVNRLEEEGRSPAGRIELEFMPIELNLKYSKSVNDYIVLDLGGGVSKTSVEEVIRNPGKSRRAGWQHGLQAFAGLNFLMGDFFAGFNVKWQTMDDFKASSYDYNNIRLGFRAGIIF